VSQPYIGRPNGLAITPDDRTLYVIDSHNVAGGNRKIWAFDVAGDGTLNDQRLVFDFGRGRGGDGMRLDREGNLWVAAGVMKARNPHETTDVKTGVYVISPAGQLLGRIPIPEDVITNLAFAGPEMKTLYVTAGKTIFRIETSVSGYAIFPQM
jgi:gluconolactonase